MLYFLEDVLRKEPEGKNAKGKNFWKLRGRKKGSQKIFQKISQKSFLLDFSVFLDIFEIFAKIAFFSEKFPEVFTLWVFTLKPVPGPLFSQEQIPQICDRHCQGNVARPCPKGTRQLIATALASTTSGGQQLFVRFGTNLQEAPLFSKLLHEWREGAPEQGPIAS